MAPEIFTLAPGQHLIIAIEGIGECYQVSTFEASDGYVEANVLDLNNDALLDVNTFFVEG